MLQQDKQYIYNYSFHEAEENLARMEMRSLFNKETSEDKWLKTNRKIDASRSPFIKSRIEIIWEETELDTIIKKVKNLDVRKETFKVIFVPGDKRIAFSTRRSMEKEIGIEIQGTADMNNPTLLFAIMPCQNNWVFGIYQESESVWFAHQNKPNNYSTALSTRVARAITNIAVPVVENKKVIDPCCGIGTVLIEAKSMGINIVGGDNNPLVTGRARENLAYFHYDALVNLQDITDITEHFDVAIIDMPYNLCSVQDEHSQLGMLKSAKRIADKVVLITTEKIDHMIEDAGLIIKDRCVAEKGHFFRQILVCSHS